MLDQKRKSALQTALVVDDHAVTRFGMAQFLRDKLGVSSSVEAENFHEAIEILEGQKIDLAVFDLGIPGLRSPLDLAAVRDRWPQMRVVVLSGSDLRGNILEALEAGVHGYFIKTETMDHLADRLAYVMGGGIFVPPCLADRSKLPSSGNRRPAPGDAASPVKVTMRQRQVLEGIVRGQSNKQIAKELKLSIGTVKMHVSAVLTALGAQNRSHAAALGRKLIE